MKPKLLLISFASALLLGTLALAATTYTATSSVFDNTLTLPAAGDRVTAAAINGPVQELANGLRFVTTATSSLSSSLSGTETTVWTERTLPGAFHAWEDGGRQWIFTGYGSPTTAEVLTDGRFHMVMDTGPGDLWGADFSGKKIITSVSKRPLTRMILTTTVSQADEGTWLRSGICVLGTTLDPWARSWICAMLEKNASDYWVRGVYSDAGTGGAFGVATVDASYASAGTQLELTVTADAKATFRYKKVGGAWSAASAAHSQPGLAIQAIMLAAGHSTGTAAQTWWAPPVIVVD
jgi:hypothetical protein